MGNSSGNDSLVRSGSWRLFLDAYRVYLGLLGRFGVNLVTFPENKNCPITVPIRRTETRDRLLGEEDGADVWISDFSEHILRFFRSKKWISLVCKAFEGLE